MVGAAVDLGFFNLQSASERVENDISFGNDREVETHLGSRRLNLILIYFFYLSFHVKFGLDAPLELGLGVAGVGFSEGFVRIALGIADGVVLAIFLTLSIFDFSEVFLEKSFNFSLNWRRIARS